MKKVFSCLSKLALVNGCLLLASCGSGKVSVSEVETAYGKTVASTVEIYRKAQETVCRYVNLEDESRGLENEGLTLEEVGKFLPADLSTLKRSVSGSGRGVDSTEISLQDELDELAGQYKKILEENSPDLSALEGIDGVEVSEGIIYLSNGQVVQSDTPEGIAMAEYLISVEETGSGEAYIKKMTEDAERIMAMNSTASGSRGIYFANPILGYGQKWTDGKVNYRWGSSITPLHKQALIDAMNTWTTSTDGKVSFAELEDNSWNNFLLAVGNLHVVTYETKDLSANKASGITFPLGMGYFGQLAIDKSCVDGDYKKLTRTALHELGHVLGLIHEHQRWDRDNYVYVDYVNVSWENFLTDMNTNFNNVVIPHYLGGLVWKIQSFSVGWFTIYLPVLVWDSQATLLVTGSDSFDFDSIMLYSGLKLVNQNVETGTVCSRYSDLTKGIVYKGTKFNDSLSKKDIQTVKSLY